MKYSVHAKIKKSEFERILIQQFGAKNITCSYLNIEEGIRIPRCYLFRVKGQHIATWGSGTGTIFERRKEMK